MKVMIGREITLKDEIKYQARMKEDENSRADYINSFMPTKDYQNTAGTVVAGTVANIVGERTR